MASVVEICNLALSLLGQKTINSLSDNSPEARACSLHWTPLRNEVLRSHRWNCVKRRAVLNRLVETPAFGYAYYYQLPTKCLMVLGTYPDSAFEVEGRRLLTDESSVSIEYIEADDDTTVYDSQLTTAFAHKLAGRMAQSMTGSNSLGEAMSKMGDTLLSDAKASDALEGKTYHPHGQRWTRAKLGGR